MLEIQPAREFLPFYDELYDASGAPRPQYAALAATLRTLGRDDLLARVTAINTALLQRGVTFTVYADSAGTERVFPFDVLPRIITADEWSRVTSGIAQRVRAINAFIYDVYHSERILREGRIPRELVYSSKNYNREMIDVDVARDIYIHVSGVDLIRDEQGEFLVLEDNCRTPSGISYVLVNRDVL